MTRSVIQIPVGLQGQTGAPGLRGSTGLLGPTGVEGLVGNTGIPGATGLQGLAGAEGSTGSPGLPGATGIQGLSGATGLQGIEGSQGATGTAGIGGSQGATGIAGADGSQGATGLRGVTGPSGTGGSGSSSFLNLTDVIPSGYSGQAGKLVAVDDGATGLVFIDSLQISNVSDWIKIESFTLNAGASSDSKSVSIPANALQVKVDFSALGTSTTSQTLKAHLNGDTTDGNYWVSYPNITNAGVNYGATSATGAYMGPDGMYIDYDGVGEFRCSVPSGSNRSWGTYYNGINSAGQFFRSFYNGYWANTADDVSSIVFEASSYMQVNAIVYYNTLQSEATGIADEYLFLDYEISNETVDQSISYDGGTYPYLRIEWSSYESTLDGAFYISFNGDTSAGNYESPFQYGGTAQGGGTQAGSAGYGARIGHLGKTANGELKGDLRVNGGRRLLRSIVSATFTSGSEYTYTHAPMWGNTADEVTSLRLRGTGATTISGRIKVWGRRDP
jgi:hypothetical protein